MSDLRLTGAFRYVLGAETGRRTDEISYDGGDLSLASQGGDRWTMPGSGETLGVLTVIDHQEPATCTSGPARRGFSVTLRTDGLTADVELTGHPASEVRETCSNGLSVPMHGGAFGSLRASKLPVAVGDTQLPQADNWLLSAIIGAAAQGGGSMTTDQSTVLRLSCEGQ